MRYYSERDRQMASQISVLFKKTTKKKFSRPTNKKKIIISFAKQNKKSAKNVETLESWEEQKRKKNFFFGRVRILHLSYIQNQCFGSYFLNINSFKDCSYSSCTHERPLFLPHMSQNRRRTR